ncbi:MAG TPA: twin-arginine translocase TatA/TatE family subunit [Candidatus Binataceae bacterium]|nr:twin-arginine translocase TatA/TatE family subunit [Candidatus Binataceae bacterium]
MDILSPWHLIVILAIVLIIFGPSKLGDVGGAMGKAIRDFKKAMNEPDDVAKTTSAPAMKSEQPAAPENKPVNPA